MVGDFCFCRRGFDEDQAQHTATNADFFTVAGFLFLFSVFSKMVKIVLFFLYSLYMFFQIYRAYTVPLFVPAMTK